MTYNEIGKKANPNFLYSLALKYFEEDPSLIPVKPASTMSTLPAPISTRLSFLHRLKIENVPLTSLEHLPLSIKRLTISGALLENLETIPPALSNLQYLGLSQCPNLISLLGLPKVMPDLTNLYIDTCPIQTLTNLPDMPKLKMFTFKKTHIRNFTGLSELNYRVVINPSKSKVISPHALPRDPDKKDIGDYFEYIQYTLDHHLEEFPPSYLPKLNLDQYSWQDILSHFHTDPTSLAAKYVAQRHESGPETSQFEQDRIWAEGTRDTFNVLREKLPPTDPILIRLSQRLKIPVKIDSFYL
jgi:hypothetical protein